jgi:hypothetical protein
LILKGEWIFIKQKWQVNLLEEEEPDNVRKTAVAVHGIFYWLKNPVLAWMETGRM